MSPEFQVRASLLVLSTMVSLSACSKSDASADAGPPIGPEGGGATGGDMSAALRDGATTATCPSEPIPLFTETTLPDEATQFAALGAKIQSIQSTFQQNNGGPVLRGFHAKVHACVQADFVVQDARFLTDAECTSYLAKGCPDDGTCSSGVFARPATYKAWVRFSNGLGYVQADSRPDVRGMAIKVMGVPGAKVLADAASVDFLMTNATTALTDSAQDFMDFAQSTTSTASLATYLAGHPTTASRLLARTSRTIVSMLQEQFWSGSAYRLGRHAIKFTAKPRTGQGEATAGSSDDYLRDDIVATLAAQDVIFDFLVQVQLDPEAQPIERPTVEWAEASAPFRQVATLTIHRQDVTSVSDAKAEAFCSTLAFQPWHTLPEQRPLGSQNRARKFVYDASAKARKAAPEPTGNETF